ncbi:MAG TPA: molybdopterin-dependent oxidoreductase, partial [Nevskiaceae bacterium]|nr:molybdopterin-dependent oxidoreductase [Nevskiaceae bacterium]
PLKNGTVEISGDAKHPANAGKLCVKGSALGETVSLDGRLLHPIVRGQRAGWDTALDTVAREFKAVIEEYGPDAVAFYVSGQLLTEDYYVANKLMKGYIGSANIDTNSRLCMSSAVAGHKRAFGEDLVPVSYDDLEQSDLVLLVGSNTAWCHPVVYQRIARAKEQRPEMKVVVLDPRRTATCDIADLHLPLKPGSDVWLFNGLLAFLHRHGVEDTAFIDAHTAGLARTLVIAENTAGDVRSVARACGVDEAQLGEFFGMFARTEKVITMFSQGVNQSSAGADKVNSIINCHLLTGRIGKPGTGPFSITGQPNAMGGREVGGLANMLAAHMELGNAAHRETVREFWNSPVMADHAGLKAVELFDAMAEGKIKAVWIMATNPVVSLPDADKVKAALSRCKFVVVSDVIGQTDTNAFAHVLLPAAAWGEKDGTVTNSERQISRQRAFLPLPGEAKPDWWIVSEVGKRMGYADAFAYRNAAQIFAEHAALSAYRNHDERAFNIGAHAQIDTGAYDDLQPFRWGAAQLFADGRFYHQDRRARFVPTPPRAPANPRDDEYPLVLNTGRVRDHWHTMTRTARSPKLSSHIAEPFLDLHPQDALICGVRAGELARVSSRWGSMVARVQTGGGIARGQVFAPIHWNAQHASDARVGSVVNPVVDPVSGEPEFKHTPVKVEPFGVSWHGFALTRDGGARLPAHDDISYWARITGAQFTRYELAGRGTPRARGTWARALLDATDAQADWLEYEDESAGLYRGAHVEGGRLRGCIYLSPRPDLPSRAWLSSLYAKKNLDDADRAGLLLGAPLASEADHGPTVCSCFGVGRNLILRTAREKKLKTPGEVTACLKAGGNCGSCVPEIRALLAEASTEAA